MSWRVRLLSIRELGPAFTRSYFSPWEDGLPFGDSTPEPQQFWDASAFNGVGGWTLIERYASQWDTYGHAAAVQDRLLKDYAMHSIVEVSTLHGPPLAELMGPRKTAWAVLLDGLLD
jgi:hypothetical protein